MKIGRLARREESEAVWCRQPARQVGPADPTGTRDCCAVRERQHAGETLPHWGPPAARQLTLGGSGRMQVVHERCCGLDVHKKTVVACVLTPDGREVRTFGTMTRELLRLSDWLDEQRVSHVAMESTGVYWKPIYNILEDQGMELLVVNAQHMKAVPGRKTDVKDSEWIADLLRHGLLRASFIPDRGKRELRELVRYRRTLINQRADVVRRLQKGLEGANIKLGDVASDVMGASGRAMLRALAYGN